MRQLPKISNGARNRRPKLTVISPSLNTGRFLRETVNSIFNQSYKDFEYLVIDGGSTDETLTILKEYSQRYPQIRWISEKDTGYLEAFRKGLAMARGEYIIHCCISDGYLDKDWFQKCMDVLDSDSEVSLVWGLPQYMAEKGQLKNVCYPQFHKSLPPQKAEFVYYWLSTYFWLPEGNFCLRKNVLDECFPLDDNLYDKERNTEPWLEFNYKFNTLGYLPYFIPTVANFGRIHKNQRGEKEKESGIANLRIRNYFKKIRTYRKKIIFGTIIHQYKDGRGQSLPCHFSISKFILRYMLAPTNIVTNIARLLMTHFDLKKKLPRIYKTSKKIFYKLMG